MAGTRSAHLGQRRGDVVAVGRRPLEPGLEIGRRVLNLRLSAEDYESCDGDEDEEDRFDDRQEVRQANGPFCREEDGQARDRVGGDGHSLLLPGRAGVPCCAEDVLGEDVAVGG